MTMVEIAETKVSCILAWSAKLYMQLDVLELLKFIECNITIKILINFIYLKNWITLVI